MQAVTNVPRVAVCGRRRHGGAAAVSVGLVEGVASWGGVQTCGSVSLCPCCSVVVRERRADEIRAASVAHLMDPAGCLDFVTLTVRHRMTDRLEATHRGLMAAMRRIGRHSRYRAVVAGRSARALEVTWGANGWHPHLHLLVGHTLTAAARAEFLAWLTAAWLDAVEAEGLPRPTAVRGVVVRSVGRSGAETVAAYLTKVQEGQSVSGWDVPREIVRGDLKTGRSVTSYTPFDLAVAGAKGDRRARAAWREFEDVMRGKKVLHLGDAWAAVVVDQADDDAVAAAAVPVDRVVVVEFSDEEWAVIVRAKARASLLDICEREGLEGVLRRVRALRIGDRYRQSKALRDRDPLSSRGASHA